MNELSTTQESLVPEIHNPYADDAKEIVTSSSFLPRIQLYISTSPAVKDEIIPQNCYGLVSNKEIQNLGKETDILVITFRMKAIDTSDKNNFRASFDIKSNLFKEIKERSAVKDSHCQYGVEFLVWVPAKLTFATYFMGSATARNEAQSVIDKVGKAATLKSRKIDNGTHSWQGPLCTICSTPFELPDKQMILDLAESFLKPKEQAGLEKVEEVESRDR